jgi:zinc transport system ATP-binding protein
VTPVAEPEPLLRAEGLDVSLGGRSILEHVSLAVGAGEIVTVIGPNGAGKTVLVRAILGLLRPNAGTVALKPGTRIGYVPQRLHIDPVMPLTVARFLTLGQRKPRDAVEAALAETGAGHVIDSAVQRISGGEFQRVLLARALVRDPELLVLDEPVQGVDVGGQGSLYRLITRLRDRRGCGVLMVSHDLHLVMASTDRVVCINHHVCCTGHPETVARDPAYLELFGPETAKSMAVYVHDHDHAHDAAGRVVDLPPAEPPRDRGRHRHG